MTYTLEKHHAELIAKVQEKCVSNEWASPLTLTKMQSIEQSFKGLKDDEKSYVIDQCVFLPQDKNESIQERKVKEAPLRDFLQVVLQYIERDPSNEAYEKLINDCQAYLKMELKLILTDIRPLVKEGKLQSVISAIKHERDRLTFSIAYEILSKEQSDLILSPLYEKQLAFENIVNFIHDALQRICEQAKSGVIIDEIIHQEVNHFIQTRPFKALPELSPASIAKYVNDPEILRMVHYTIMKTRGEYCCTMLENKEEDYLSLRNELKKVTVYRVRRNVIRYVFQRALQGEDEEVLICLQEEYLQAIQRQVEEMEQKKAQQFLKNFIKDPVLAPLGKNDFAQRELKLLISYINLLGVDKEEAKEASLHDINSPIEMDVIGEMTRALTLSVRKEHEEMEEANEVMQELKKTYDKVNSPDFSPCLLLEDYIVNQDKHTLLKEKILAQHHFMVRRDIIQRLYVFAQNKENFPKEKRWIYRVLDLNPLHEKSLIFLQKLYMDTLKEQIHSIRYTTLRDQYIAYRWILITAFGSPVTQRDYLKWLALLQYVLDQPITAPADISSRLLRGP